MKNLYLKTGTTKPGFRRADTTITQPEEG